MKIFALRNLILMRSLHLTSISSCVLQFFIKMLLTRGFIPSRNSLQISRAFTWAPRATETRTNNKFPLGYFLLFPRQFYTKSIKYCNDLVDTIDVESGLVIEFIGRLNLVIATIAIWLFHTLHSSLQHSPSLPCVCCRFHQSSGNGFQRRTFTFF
jgi:hypothetical protein